MQIPYLAGGLLLAAILGAGGLWVGSTYLAAEGPGAPLASTAAVHGDTRTNAAASQADAACTILYYRNPMGLPDVSYEPKQDNMGMDYIPVCAEAAGGLVVSPERQQSLGVTFVEVVRRDLMRSIDATGLVTVNERAVSVVAPRVEGWIEDLLVDAPGDAVAKGMPLARVYSPELILAQVNYRQAAADGTARASGLAERLRLLGLSEEEIARLAAGGEVGQTALLVAPQAGTVMEKMATDGMYFAAGTPLMRIADLSRLWVIAEVYERDLSLLDAGAAVEVQVEAYPGRRFAGTIETLLPEVMADTRTVQVRIALDNAEGLLLPGMFARVRLIALAAADALIAPRSAVLDASDRQVVLVSLGEGRFEVRPVALGAAADGFVQLAEGVAEGERLVETAAFLIDAESSIRAALEGFAPAAGATQAPEQQP
jgi:Cu(I)/Ag(I) efflux system membrane fusion protein